MLDVSRRELKYILTKTEALVISKRLSHVIKADKNNHGKGYMVRSLYFDTLFDKDFEEKADGLLSRRKIRLRVYNGSSSVVKLELKQKEGNDQRKRSLILNEEEARRMISCDYDVLRAREEPLAKELYYYMKKHVYRPKVVVEYDREAYIALINDTRITFDKNLRATEADYDIFKEKLHLYPAAPSNEVTMEVKYNGFLMTYIKDVISQADREQVSNSKYMRSRCLSKHGRF